jgi:hypothetical protein
MIAAPRRCPYCVSQGIFLQMENHTQYLAHMMDYIYEDFDRSNKLQCSAQISRLFSTFERSCRSISV